MIAALYVAKGGCYSGLPGVDAWDEERDARRYAGPWPVVAHPPCQRWGKMWFGQPLCDQKWASSEPLTRGEYASIAYRHKLRIIPPWNETTARQFRQRLSLRRLLCFRSLPPSRTTPLARASLLLASSSLAKTAATRLPRSTRALMRWSGSCGTRSTLCPTSIMPRSFGKPKRLKRPLGASDRRSDERQQYRPGLQEMQRHRIHRYPVTQWKICAAGSGPG